MADEIAEKGILIKDFFKMGYRPVVLALLADGYDAVEIVSIIEDEYGQRLNVKSLASWLSRGDGKGIKELQKSAIQREASEIHAEALRALKKFRDGMEEAESLPDMVPGKSGSLVPNKYRLELMKFYSQRFGEWWDRLGKMHDIGTPRSSTTNIVTGDVSISPVQIIMEELQSGAVDAEALSRIIDKLGG